MAFPWEQFHSEYRKWRAHCVRTGINPISPAVSEALNFLQALREEPGVHRGFSAITTAKSALSSVVILPNSQKLGDHPLVKQYMKGLYNQQPPSHRYVRMWDPADILEKIQEEPWVTTTDMELKFLSMKVVMLILLTTSKRGQIIPALDLNDMIESEDSFHFRIPCTQLKEGRPGYKPKLIKLSKFSDQNICVVYHLKEYLRRTQDIRGEVRQVFITAKKPHRPVSRDTVSLWVKETLKRCGVDTNEYAAGSTRADSSSKAKQKGVPLDEILEAGVWSRATTFTAWYNKKLVRSGSSVAEAVLNWAQWGHVLCKLDESTARR